MKWLTLVEIELRKVIPFLIGLFSLSTLLNVIFFFRKISSAKEAYIQEALNAGVSLKEYANINGKLSFVQVFESTPIFTYILSFMVLALIGLSCYLWYKEWFGTSKRIYTLLTLKGSRLHIFTSKLTVFMMSFLSYFGVVIANLYVADGMMKWLVPSEMVLGNTIQNMFQQSQMFSMIFPTTIERLSYSIAFLIFMFSILSVSILMDRSKRIWGLVGGILFGGTFVTAFISMFSLPLYYDERFIAMWSFAGVGTILCLIIMTYLLKKKVTI